ncbi:MAG: hypothetical protein IKB03_00025 [Tidjanibacter sp.]|nr:hypothetical protein [Tidjanibacter sp.]
MFGIGQSLRRKPRQFSYNPRYYDAELEARNQRRIELGHAPIEKDDKGERKPGDLLRAKAQQRHQRNEEVAAARRKGNATRLVLVVMLIIGFYALLRSIVF